MITEIFIPKMGANIDKAIVGEIKVTRITKTGKVRYSHPAIR